jgi:hypothetical protein
VYWGGTFLADYLFFLVPSLVANIVFYAAKVRKMKEKGRRRNEGGRRKEEGPAGGMGYESRRQK